MQVIAFPQPLAPLQQWETARISPKRTSRTPSALSQVVRTYHDKLEAWALKQIKPAPRVAPSLLAYTRDQEELIKPAKLNTHHVERYWLPSP